MRTSLVLTGLFLLASPAAAQQTLPGTKPLTLQGDLAAQMVAGIDRHLMKALDASVEKRRQAWQPDTSSPEAYRKWLEPKRERLRKILGVVDPRVPFADVEYVSSTGRPALLGESARPALLGEPAGLKIYAVRWPVLPGVWGEGLLVEPRGKPLAGVVLVPDADQTPEAALGLGASAGPLEDAGLWLVGQGCRVLVPTLIDRQDTWSGNQKIALTNQPHREFVYRMAYEMGRHVIGYEVQKILAAVDWLARDKDHPPVGVFGHGEGGLLALYSAALDERIVAAGVSGYFGPRERVWAEPIYRNVWGLLKDFGDKELAQMVLPRTLIIADVAGPAVSGPPPARAGRLATAAPGKITYTEGAALAEAKVPQAVAARLKLPKGLGVVVRSGPSLHECWRDFRFALLREEVAAGAGAGPRPERAALPDAAARQHRQFRQLVDYTQKLLPEGDALRRQRFWDKGNLSSLEKWQDSVKAQRDYFWDEVIGKLPAPTGPMNVRTRLIYDEPKWKGYEVVLDLYDDVICYGILLVPNDIAPGERRPVVVCQHGLEGRPTDVVNPRERTRYYNSFGAQLANLGYVVFAPQNPYIGHDAFRVLVRKANPLGLSLYSFIVRQHERILDWLVTLPFVDRTRIAYYGLSYGGKVAMRIPALLGRYCAVICSGDFNEWIWKNINLLWRGSYMFTIEYDMYEFDLGNTFNYAEMAALIAPRPFMVERGHHDGVGLDEWVAYEYAKVRRLYADLGIPERTTIEFFNGQHEIHGKGTFAFLSRHLHWPPEKVRESR
jgi:cephalosporin-C deacetylase-like acetyl esterase